MLQCAPGWEARDSYCVACPPGMYRHQVIIIVAVFDVNTIVVIIVIVVIVIVVIILMNNHDCPPGIHRNQVSDIIIIIIIAACLCDYNYHNQHYHHHCQHHCQIKDLFLNVDCFRLHYASCAQKEPSLKSKELFLLLFSCTLIFHFVPCKNALPR